MGESFIASAQYGDLKGTVSIDGHQTGGPLEELARHTCMKTGFFPVGFGMNGLDPDDQGRVAITIFAVDVREVGVTVDQIKAYVAENGDLPVTGFRGAIDIGTFGQYFKRFRLRAHMKHIKVDAEQIDIVDYQSGEDE